MCDTPAMLRELKVVVLVFELAKRGYPDISRSMVYRVLVRYGPLEPVPRRRRRGQYRRWERSAAMELWQLDVTASLFLADGRECKIITGIDDHSRFCVIATVVARATARAVCSAFVTAMQEYGIPGEAGRPGRPHPVRRHPGPHHRLPRPARSLVPATRGPHRNSPPAAAAEPLVVKRRVSERGAIMVGGQKIQAGLVHARKTVGVAVESDTYQITVEPGIIITAPRATSRDIRRHKASSYD